MVQDLQNSITRYVRNNFGDGPRQDGFDLLLGSYLPTESGASIFADRRPLLIQAIPYLLAASVFMVSVAVVTPRLPDSATLPLRIFIAFWMGIALWSMNFIYGHGTLYVGRSLIG